MKAAAVAMAMAAAAQRAYTGSLNHVLQPADAKAIIPIMAMC